MARCPVSRADLKREYKEVGRHGVAEKYGVVPATVTNWMARYNLTMRGRGRPRTPLPFTRLQLERLWKQHGDLPAVAEAVGLTLHKVVYYKILLEAKKPKREKPVCSVSRCTAPMQARGVCWKHYKQNRRREDHADTT